jgi:hypothetical protein
MTTILEHRCSPAKWTIIERYVLHKGPPWHRTNFCKVIVQQCTKCGLIRSEKFLFV